MKQSRYQVLLEEDLLKIIDQTAKKKGVSRAEHIKDLLKESLNKKIKLPKSSRTIPCQVFLPDWLKEELLKRTEKENITLAKYVREVCVQSTIKKN